MLSFAEEIYLLALDEDSGKIMPDIRNPVLGAVIIGAALTELVFLKKISTTKERLRILDTKNTNSPILNNILKFLQISHKKSARIEDLLRALMTHSKRLEELVLAELIKKGILKEVDKKILWIFSDKQYPLINNEEIVNVQIRIRKLVLSDKKANPKDAALVSLIQASKLFTKILSKDEYIYYRKRIIQLSKTSNIGEKVDELIYQLRDLPDSPYPDCLTEEDTIE